MGCGWKGRYYWHKPHEAGVYSAVYRSTREYIALGFISFSLIIMHLYVCSCLFIIRNISNILFYVQ